MQVCVSSKINNNTKSKIRPNSRSSLSSSTADSEKIEKYVKLVNPHSSNKERLLNDRQILNMDHLKKTMNTPTETTSILKPTSQKRAMVVDHSIKDKLYQNNGHSPGMLKK